MSDRIVNILQIIYPYILIDIDKDIFLLYV